MFNNSGVFNINIISELEVKNSISQNQDLLKKLDEDKECNQLFNSISNIEVDKISYIAQSIDKNFKNIVLVGIGGSSLGVKAFLKNNESQCYFMENIDPVSINITINSIDFNKSLFIFVSKSGFTIETLSQAEFIINWLKHKNINVGKHCISISSPGLNDLNTLSKQNNITIYDWHQNVGGRFSAFTISTLLPLALLGYNLNLIAKAGKELNPANGLTGAAINYLLWQKGYDINVLMPYSDQLNSFALWYRQLWAESIGKEGFGSMPEISTGTIDQHSMLQMYLGGKKNKFFTLIEIDIDQINVVDNANEYTSINPIDIAQQHLEVKFNHSSFFNPGSSIKFSDMLKKACNATAKSMIEENCPVRIITIPIVNEYYIAKMMIDFIYETIFTCYLANKYLGHNISPFGQPNVEKSKKNLIESIKNI